MAIVIQTHADHPHMRALTPLERKGCVVAYPTPAGYALGCHLNDFKAIQSIQTMRSLSKSHYFTVVCQDLKTASAFVRISTPIFRTLKSHGCSVTIFILPALKSISKSIAHQKRQAVGVRIPDDRLTQAMLALYDGAMLSVSAIGEEARLDMPYAASDIVRLYPRVDYVLETRPVLTQPSSVIDCTEDHAMLCIRSGIGVIPDGCEFSDI